MNFLSQYMSRFGPNMADEGGFMRQRPFQVHTGGPGQVQGYDGSGINPQTGGGLPPMGRPTMHPNMGGGLPPMQGGMNANTGGGLPAMLSGLQANTGGYDAPSQFVNTGGGVPPQAFSAYTGGGLPPQAQGQGFGLRGLMDWGRRMGGRSY